MSDINLTCYVLSITSTEGKLVKETGIEPDRIHIEQLQANEKTIVSNLFSIDTGKITSAEIEIVVSYKPFILPFRQEKVFRYATEEDRWGDLHWMPRSNSDDSGN